MRRTIEISRATGEIQVCLRALKAGDDLAVVLDGGTHPHIGAVAVSQPRPSLKDDGSISATTSVIALFGHKEDGVSKACAEQIASQLNITVTVICGIHIDDIEPSQLKYVAELINDITDELIWTLRKNQER